MFAAMHNRNGRPMQGGDVLQFHRGNGSSGGRSGRDHNVRFQEENKFPSPWDPLVFLVTSLLAVVCVAGLMTILGVLYLTVRPFSKPVYRRLAAQLGAASFLDALALLLPNTRIVLTGDSDVPSPVGTSLFVSNHVVHADWWAVLMFGRCVGLRGTLKVFLRNDYLRINLENSNMDQNNNLSGTRRPSGALVSSNSSSRIVASTTTRSEGGSGSPASSPGNVPPTATTTTTSLASPDVTFLAMLLHKTLEFPLINGEDHDRSQLVQLLRSFCEQHNMGSNGSASSSSSSSSPVHLLLFPESWSAHNGADRKAVHAKSNEFAKREGRPQLKHLLLPRTRGFKASLECLRDSSPVVYDVTMAYIGYDGSLPPFQNLSVLSLWNTLRNGFPREIHFRIKRYSMEEVLQDSTWLDKKWAEKDRLLSLFVRHQCFPADSRGYNGRPMIFNTRHHSLESSTVALIRLLLLPCAVPVLLLLSIPLFWTLGPLWLIHAAYRYFISPLPTMHDDGQPGSVEGAGQTPGSASNNGTPYCPATPFGSPAVEAGWNDMFSSSNRD